MAAGQSIGIGLVSAISGLKFIGIGSVVKKWYWCITTKYACLAQSAATFKASILWLCNLCHSTCDATMIKMIPRVLPSR